MKRETLFLKITVLLMGLPVLALCLFVLPGFTEYFAGLTPVLDFFRYPFLIGLYATAVLFFVALYQTFKLLTYIDKNQAFSELSVKALRRIKQCAIAISAAYILFMPLIFLMAEADDAPGMVVIGMVVIFGCMVVAVFAAVLEKLLNNAIEIKSELDLTV
ncbi:DUF2975 domain-containing protein [Xylanibacillus composti]|uniref:Membrane protein n=1 Tax=Xylanibacillus composti TaxID=1572762 RepID=A0A8J4H765_9BACL|nr:DUF2975 domain-containing protein [Xylanibacillus composti]MDT9725315.1 DUF2975 domain-containing protein [Xylanibacillus composti]GIQ71186.1 membrane protein [Xylanibacillus composti]